MSRVETNYRLGRLFYMMMTDAAGYPNGMAYWEEMSAQDKYYYCMNAVDFLRKVERDMEISIGTADGGNFDYGVGDSMYGQGDCKALMDYIESVQEKEMKDFETRISSIQAVVKKYNESHPEEKDEDPHN